MPISLASSFTITVSAGDYNGVVDGLGTLVKSHWIMPTSGLTVTDRKVPKVQDGTLSGVVQYLLAPIAQGDASGRALGVSDGARINVPANAAYNATAGGVGGMFQFDRIDATQQVLFARAGALAGGMAIEINGGVLRAFRFDGGGVQRTVTATALPSVGDAHAIFMTWGTTGLELWVDGVSQGSNGATNWVVNGTIASTALSFLASSTNTFGFDGCAGHLLFLGGAQPTPAQIATLSQPENICWAVDFNAGTVPESTVLSIDIRTGGAHFKSPIVPEIMTPLPTRGTATRVGELIRYDAGAVTGDQADAIQYRVTSANGKISTTETVSLTVTEGSVGLTMLGSWPLSQTSGTTFTAATGTNHAVLTVPSWTIATHTHDRPGIVFGGTNASLEVSNGGPAITMITSPVNYRQAAMSLVVYFEPWGRWRGLQYWNEASEKFAREYIAFRDDFPELLTATTGSAAAGSFAIYRRRSSFSATTWRLGGYVRDANGTKQYFGGSYTGIASTNLLQMSRVSPGASARRVTLTQGPAGAVLWLDDTSVATLPTVTVGWQNLSGSIKIGCGDDTNHANERSPFWGRVAQVEIWQGQINPSTGAGARPDATQSPPYKEPTVGARYNVTAYSSLQACMNAANAGNGWVYQDYTNTNWYQLPIRSSLGHLNNCRGAIGLRVRKSPGETTESEQSTKHNVYAIGTNSGRGGALTSSHGDPYQSDGGYRLIGCMLDGNARGQDWSINAAGGGTTYDDHRFQFNGLLDVAGQDNSSPLTVTVDCCEFMDSTSDGVSTSANCNVTTKSSRFWGTFRGAIVVNNFTMLKNIRTIACEMDPSATLIGGRSDNGSSLNDVEPFGTTPTDRVNLEMYDCWAHGDLDDKNRGLNGAGRSWYRNVHTCGPAFAAFGGAREDGVQDYRFYACTLGYYRKGCNGAGATSSQFPHEAFEGGWPGPLGTGFLLEHCVLLAANRPHYTAHQPSPVDLETDASPRCQINYELELGQTSGRKITMRHCQWRAHDIGFVPQANRRCLVVLSSLNTGYSFELDDVKIDEVFATIPLVFGGATVRYRDVVHEGTGDTTPWSGAGAEVPI